MALQLGPAMKLRLWPEVSVSPAADQRFECINATPALASFSLSAKAP